MMISVLISLIIVFLFLLMFRVAWVSKTQFDWIYKVYDYRFDLISNNKIREYNKYSYFNFIDAVYPFHKMMLHFWLWNIKYMIEDEKLYDIVVKDNGSF